MLRSFRTICLIQFLTVYRSNLWRLLLFICAVLPFWAVPESGSSRVVLTLGRPDSSFVGLVIAHIGSLFIGLFSFFLVADPISKDSESSGRILCSTPMSSIDYLLGKAVGSFLSLVPFFLATLTGAIVVLFIRGMGSLQLWQLVAPSLSTTIVMLCFVSCLAVFLDCYGLRGTLSRVAYGLFWFASLMLSTANYFAHTSKLWGSLVDYMGQQVIHDYLFKGGLSRIYTSIMHSSDAYSQIVRESLEPLEEFFVKDMFTAQRGMILLLSLALLGLSLLRFRRFDPSKG